MRLKFFLPSVFYDFKSISSSLAVEFNKLQAIYNQIDVNSIGLKMRQMIIKKLMCFLPVSNYKETIRRT